MRFMRLETGSHPLNKHRFNNSQMVSSGSNQTTSLNICGSQSSQINHRKMCSKTVAQLPLKFQKWIPVIPIASQCICLLKLSIHPLQWGCIKQLFFLVCRKWTVIGLWPWMEKCVGLDTELLRDDWRVCERWVAVWLTPILNYKTSLELSLVFCPIADFASE